MDDHTGLANHLIRWRRVNVWDYYVLERGIGEGSIGSISLVKRRKGTEGGSAYTNHHRCTTTSDNDKEGGKKHIKGGVFGRVWSQLLQQLSHTGNQKNMTSLLKRKKHLGAKEYAVPSRHTERYALKSIQLRLVEKKYLEELRNEIDVLRHLDHPNIVKAYEVYESKSNIYIVMEYCSGGDLYARAPYTEGQALPVISQLCSAICFMHKHGVVHRDLKVENVMYESKEPTAKIKLLDFGLSKKFVPGTRGIMHDWAGTVYTMSPQVLNGTYNYKADIWSIGVLAFLLLADEKPFKGKNKQDVMQNIKKVKYNFKAHEWDSISQDAKDFVSSLLVHDQGERLSAEAALRHSWLQTKKFTSTVNLTKLIAEEEEQALHNNTGQNTRNHVRVNTQMLMRDVKDNIVAYKEASELYKIAAMVVAHQSSTAEILDIRSAFAKLDKDNEGIITRNQFKQGMAEFQYTDDELDEMFSKVVRLCIIHTLSHLPYTFVFSSVLTKKMFGNHYAQHQKQKDVDSNHHGVILYTEFIAATLEMRGQVEEKRLAQAFDLLDDDDTGFISKENLSKLLGTHVTQSRVAALIKEADTTGDGTISFEEFLQMFRKDNCKHVEEVLETSKHNVYNGSMFIQE